MHIFKIFILSPKYFIVVRDLKRFTRSLTSNIIPYLSESLATLFKAPHDIETDADMHSTNLFFKTGDVWDF